MSGTKILWGQVIVVGLIVLLAIWGATEWTAWRFAYQPELGRPWFELLGFKIYYPPIFFWWWFVYDAYAPQIFVEGAFIAASGTFVSIAVAIGMSVWRAREAKNVETYGSARWANGDEVRAAGLIGDSASVSPVAPPSDREKTLSCPGGYPNPCAPRVPWAFDRDEMTDTAQPMLRATSDRRIMEPRTEPGRCT